MAIDQNLLSKVKANRRIGHSVLDEDIQDHIAACLRDLQVCGVREPRKEGSQEMDPLILSAVKLYVWAHTVNDTAKAAAYQDRYDGLKSCLMMAAEYSGEAVIDE